MINESGEIATAMTIDNQELQHEVQMIYTECRNTAIKLKNLSPKFRIKNAFLSCSHPLVFNFENRSLLDSLDAGQEVLIPMKMRVGI